MGEGESVTAQEEPMDITSQTKDEQLVRGRRSGGGGGREREEGGEGEKERERGGDVITDCFPSLPSLTPVSVWEKKLPPEPGR